MTTKALLRAWTRHALVPSVLLVVVVVASALVASLPEAVVTVVVLGPVLLLLTGLEWVVPERSSWRPSARVWGLDAFYTFVSSHLTARLTKLLFVALLAWLAEAGALGWGLWPTSLPFLLQVVLALLLADLSLYVVHRWMHEADLGWRLHLVHHSPTALHVLASSRSHPLNVGVKFVAETGLLLGLGAPAEVITVWLCWMTTNGLLQHANVEMAVGPLRHLLATPAVHRVHHDAFGAPSNFGSTTSVWDRLLGTWRDPALEKVEEVGIAGSLVDEALLPQLVAPFLPAERLAEERR